MARTMGKALSSWAVAVGLAVSAGTAGAATVAWTDWTAVSLPNGTAAGTITPGGGGSPISVNLTGPNTGGSTTGTFFWGPAATYIGGVVSNAPCTGTPCNGDIINLTGGTPPTTHVLTFSSPVVNPVFAVWSLGQVNTPATLTFTTAGALPAIQSTGTNTTFGFQSLTATGNAVSGQEGNGTFLLPGTYSSVAFTATFENFYGFTVGQIGPLDGGGGGVPAIPEPSTWGLMLAGLGLLGYMARRRTRG